MVSVVIPSRDPRYLRKTIADLLQKAQGKIEVIVYLDGYWVHDIPDDERVVIVHGGAIEGMRPGINRAVAISRGEYVMKTDEHCMFDQGFDTKLVKDCADNWVVIPRRYRLEPETWTIIKDGRPPVDYMYLAYPYERPGDKTCGLHGSEWRERYQERRNILIDDTMSWQGSCWFMKRDYWNQLGDLDDVNYGTFTQEAQEIGNKVWLSGGRLVVNKKTWYAHWHKGEKGKGYNFSNEQYQEHQAGTEKGRRYCIDYWMNTKEYQHDFEWLLKKFWPVPTWPENWKERILLDQQGDYSIIGRGPDKIIKTK